MTLSTVPFLLFVLQTLSADPPLYPGKNPLPDHFKPWHDPIIQRTRPVRHHILSDEALQGLMKGRLHENRPFLEALNGLAQTVYGVSVLESLDVLDLDHLEMWNRMVETLEKSRGEMSESSHSGDVEEFVRHILGWEKNSNPSVILQGVSVDVIWNAISVSELETSSVIQVYGNLVSEYCFTTIHQAAKLMRILDETPRFILNKIQKNRAQYGLPELVDGLVNNESIWLVTESVVALVREYPYILPELTTFDVRSLIDIFSPSPLRGSIPEVDELTKSKLSADQIDSLPPEMKNEPMAIPGILTLLGRLQDWSLRLRTQTMTYPG